MGLQGRKRIAVAFSLFFTFIAICIIFNQALDGYFLWLCLDRHGLTVYWQKNCVYTAQTPLNLSYPLWIPLAPLAIMIAYLVEAERNLNFNVSFYGRRIHHYQVGLLSIGIAALLVVFMITCGEPTTMQLGWKRTTIPEILQGLSFILILGGITLISLDAKDLSSAVVNRPRK